MFKSRRSGRKVTILDEDENYIYFVWEDFPNTVAQWAKNPDIKYFETFYEYFIPCEEINKETKTDEN